ncbi:MAG: alpha/beta fold hydrolase [Rhodospirillales bacterium]|nr:alpha/beta fold hydrolase [Rhodospirillales bacterium]
MFNLFTPRIFNSGYLPEKEGHRVYFMEIGNPDGEPVLIFNGGPGGVSKTSKAAMFDRKKYRIIMFDQRGCGKSMPAGEMENNDSIAALEDAERLIKHLNIKKPLIVRGGSWGSTLALLFALRNPQSVKMLLLSQIFLADSDNKKWMEEDSGLFYPDMLEKLDSSAPKNKRLNLAQRFAKMMNSYNLGQQVKAVCTYGCYERVLGNLSPDLNIKKVTQDDINSNMIYINYCAQNFMLEDKCIINNTSIIEHIPTLIVHNRLDMVCPLCGAYELHKHLPNSKLVIVPDIGHGSKLLHKTIKKEIKRFLG